jgi:hypothetical protein
MLVRFLLHINHGTYAYPSITTNLGTYAWTLWISTVIAGFSVLCAVAVFILDKYLRRHYAVTDQTTGLQHTGAVKGGVFSLKAVRHLGLTFWLVVLFAVFENAGVQSFVSISTQFAQQRLNKGTVIGGWVSSFYLLLPACATPFIGIFIDLYGNRISFRRHPICRRWLLHSPAGSLHFRSYVLDLNASSQTVPFRSILQ